MAELEVFCRKQFNTNFRHNYIFVDVLGFVRLLINSLCVVSRLGLQQVRQQTLSIVERYKHQLSVDFGALNSDSSENTKVIVDENNDKYDPNSVVLKNSGPLPEVVLAMM